MRLEDFPTRYALGVVAATKAGIQCRNIAATNAAGKA